MMMRLQSNVALMQRPAQRVGSNNEDELKKVTEEHANNQKIRDAEYQKLLATHADNEKQRQHELAKLKGTHEAASIQANEKLKQHRIKADAKIAGHQADVDKAWAEVEHTKARTAIIKEQIAAIEARTAERKAAAEATKAAAKASKAVARLTPQAMAAKLALTRWVVGGITAASSILGGSWFMSQRIPAPQAPQQLEHQLEQQIQRQAPKVLKQLK